MLPRLLTLASLALCALATTAAPALAVRGGPPATGTGPCRTDSTGPTCQIWTGHVTSINDGDTVAVDIDGDGNHTSYNIRFVGIQAMEETRYSSNPAKRRGQCHAVAATNAIEKLIDQAKGRVRLTAQQPGTDRVGRLFRSIAVRIGGRWKDLGETEMARGLTLWMHVRGETAWNLRYNTLGQEAQHRHIGMWNPTTCGVGPDQDVPLKTWVMSDPLGDDPSNLDGEYIRIENLSPTVAVPLAGWWVRDSGLRRFTFPAGTVLRPGHTITVHVGSGQSSGDTFYWGLPGTIFENTASGGDQGDGAYLFDPQGDLRSYLVYPCLVACSDPNQGAIQLTAHATGVEYALIKDVSNHPVDLYGYELRTPGGYGFDDNSTLQPGETMEVDVKGDPSTDTRLHKHMGIDGAYLPDRGGALQVTTFDEIPLACDAWGSGRC
jgi:endonuclease YncB( thermonuclease family)